MNPNSERPAGVVIITTLLGDYVVDTGVILDTFTPEPGNIQGTSIVVINPVTSGTDSSYTLVYQPTSLVPANGYIVITVPIRLVLRPQEVRSGGICADPNFFCDENIINNTIIIRTI